MPATIKANDYTIKIRRGLIERLGIEILRLAEELEHEILLITDENVSELFLQQVIMNFKECPKPEGTQLRICELLVNPNETAKNFKALSTLLEKISELGLSEKCIIVALGGSVVCDIAGFAANVYMGGVRLVLVPTTIVAMIESSVNCSASLNLHTGKNLAGMSCTPSLVLCDIDCLKTLSPEEYKSGIAEALKTAICSGEKLFKIFERGIVDENLEKVIEYCIKFKAENNLYAKIGYTIGEALEILSNYEIQHGLAVATGLAIIARAGEKLDWCSHETSTRIINSLHKNNLPITCQGFTPSEITRAVLNVHKTSGGNIELAVLAGIGEPGTKTIKADELESIISLGMN